MMKDIRRLYCSASKRRFTERQGTLLRYCKLPEEAVVRIVKCLGHGCSVEATADLCDVDPRTVDEFNLEDKGSAAVDLPERPRHERSPFHQEGCGLGLTAGLFTTWGIGQTAS
jgi:hypothetical protein